MLKRVNVLWMGLLPTGCLLRLYTPLLLLQLCLEGGCPLAIEDSSLANFANVVSVCANITSEIVSRSFRSILHSVVLSHELYTAAVL